MNALLRRLGPVVLTAALWGGAAIAQPGAAPSSPFERPPGITDGDWKALSQALAKNIAPGQTLRPQDEATFGQGDGSTFMQFGRAFAVSGATLVVGAPAAVSCVLTTSSCSGGVGAAYVYERVAGAWQFRQKLRASDYTYSTTTNRNFGASVAIDGDTLLVGAGGAFDPVAAPSNPIGGVYVFTRTAGTWTETQKLLPPTPVPGTDEFGFSVALTGDTAVIGNPGRAVSGAARAGAVHVFTRSGGTFSQAALLTASDGAAGNRLGESVAYAGNTILAGAPLGDAPTPADSGAAYVFTGSGATWTEQAKLLAQDPLANARFGNSVALDGDSAAIGAVGWAASPATPNQGRAYVFVRSGTTWSQQQRLEAGDAQANRLGFSVAIRGDQVAVGAPETRAPGFGSNSGAVRVFVRSAGTWTLEQSLFGPEQTNTGLGIAVRLFDDAGTPALLGSTSSSPVGSTGIEALRTWRRTSTPPTPFVLDADLSRLPSTTQASFGSVIAVEGDLAVVGVPGMQQPRGAPFTDFGRVGAAYVYARNGGQWTLRQALTIAPLGGDTAAFGSAVAISGSTIAVGAPGERAAISGSGTGAAYVYTVGPSNITLQQRIAIDNVSGSNNAFGRSLSLDGDTLAVGAPFTSNPGLSNNFGRVYVYTRSGTTWTKQQEIIDASPPATSDDFGNYVILRGDAVVIGSRRSVTSGYVAYVAVATRSGSTWSIVQRILEPPDTSLPSAAGEFGLSLAWSGSTLAIGAGRHGTEQPGSTGNGRVYLYEGAPGSFALAQTLRQADGTITSTSSRFGAALALNGERLLVAAPDTSFAGGSGPIGSAYAYERVAGSWRLAARLRAASPDDTTFGFSGPLTGTGQGGSPLAQAGDQVIIGLPRSNGQAPFAAQNVGAAAIYAVPRPTTITLGASPTVAAIGEAVSARWTLSSPGGAPTGEVTIVATSGESCTAPAAAGACTITFSRAGLRLLTAVYAGAPGFGQSRSAPASVQVASGTGGLVGDDPVIPPDLGTGNTELIGFSVAMNESLIVVGAPGAGPGNSEGPGAVYVYAREGAPSGAGMAGLATAKVAQRLAVLTDATGANGHRFGHAVSVSADGTRIAVGSPAAGNGLGRAVVFLRGGASWTDRNSPNLVLAPAAAAGETVQRFGETIDVDATGNVVVGAPRTDRSGATDTGSAYVFDAAGVQRAALAATTPATNELFGSAVAIDAGLVAVGVPGTGPTAGSNRGAVATWTFDGTVATPAAVLTASDAASNHRFGSALALAGDLLAVGAPGRNGQRGGGYVFRRGAGGLTQVAVLTPDAASGVNQAGNSVAVNATTVLLGAPDSSGTSGTGTSVSTAGAVAVFRRFDGNWTGDLAQDAVLALAGANFGDRFGNAVAATASGVAIGAPFVDVAPVEGPVLTDYGLVVPYRNVALFADGFEPAPAP